jgi:WD40 repeat protein
VKEWKPLAANTLIVVENMIWAGTFDLDLLIIDPRDLKEKRRIPLAKLVGPEIGTVACLLYHGDFVWVGTANGNIVRISAKTEKIVDTLLGHTKVVHNMIPVFDEEVWSSSTDRNIRVWNTKVTTFIFAMLSFLSLSHSHHLFPHPLLILLLLIPQRQENVPLFWKDTPAVYLV